MINIYYDIAVTECGEQNYEIRFEIKHFHKNKLVCLLNMLTVYIVVLTLSYHQLF